MQVHVKGRLGPKGICAFGPGHTASSLQPPFDPRHVARRAVKDTPDIHQQPDGDLRRKPGPLPIGGKGGGVLELAGQPREEFLDLDLVHLKSPPRPTGVRTACCGVEVQSFRERAALFLGSYPSAPRCRTQIA